MLRERPFVREVGIELAEPFIIDYTDRWHLPLFKEGIESVKWLGGWFHGGLRAIGGYTEISPEFPEDRYIYGFYGDGSTWQNAAMSAVSDALMSLPFGLIGSIHFANARMIRSAVRRGFAVKRIVPEDRCVVVWRPLHNGATA